MCDMHHHRRADFVGCKFLHIRNAIFALFDWTNIYTICAHPFHIVCVCVSVFCLSYLLVQKHTIGAASVDDPVLWTCECALQDWR